MVVEDVSMHCIKVLFNVTRKPHANLFLSITYINFNQHTLICRLKQTCKLSADGKKALRAFLTGLFRGAYIWIQTAKQSFFSQNQFFKVQSVSQRFSSPNCTSLTACLYSTFALAPRLLFGPSYEKDRLFCGLIWMRLLIRREVDRKAHLKNVQVISLWYLLD